FGAFFIHHNPDDLDVLRRTEVLEDRLAVGHLRHGFWRNKTDRVDVAKTGLDQAAKVARLEISRDLPRQTLPGVARTLDNLDRLCHLTGRITQHPGFAPASFIQIEISYAQHSHRKAKLESHSYHSQSP